MEPMRVYGANVIELFMGRFLVALGWILGLFALGVGIALSVSGDDGAGAVFIDGFLGGVLVASTGLTAAVIGLAGAGIRQNRAALDVGFVLLALVSAGWLASLAVSFKIGSLSAGLIILALFWFFKFLRREAIEARFKPRFLSLRQFETMVQIADTMIEADGRPAVHPIDAAMRVDHLLAEVQQGAAPDHPVRSDVKKLAEIEAPVLSDIRKLLFAVEWVLPLLIFRPFPFSSLGSHERRRAVERVIDSRFGMFRDMARVIKTAACVGYYGSPEAMEQIGYKPFDDRERARGVSQTPRTYPDPFLEVDTR